MTEREHVTIVDLIELAALGGPEELARLVAELATDPAAVMARLAEDGPVLIPRELLDGAE